MRYDVPILGHAPCTLVHTAAVEMHTTLGEGFQGRGTGDETPRRTQPAEFKVAQLLDIHILFIFSRYLYVLCRLAAPSS